MFIYKCSRVKLCGTGRAMSDVLPCLNLYCRNIDLRPVTLARGRLPIRLASGQYGLGPIPLTSGQYQFIQLTYIINRPFLLLHVYGTVGSCNTTYW